MTPARQARKTLAGFPAGFLALLLCTVLAPTWSLWAATTERVVTDRHTGLALFGYDPVAYFTEARPVAGSPKHEYRHAGVVWRFRNEGNRAAFAANPEVYMPRFGGYDPVGIARGVATPGHPALWARVGNELYLFYNVEGRDAFVTNPAKVIGGAEVRWSDVLRALSP
jgi:hypothetical protein